MILNFIFSNLNIVALVAWVIFLGIILIRYIRPHWVKNISYAWLILGAITLHLFYAVFVTWGQYHLWSVSSDFTRMLLSAPLPPEAPLPWMLEFIRSYFEGSLGYFVYYAFGHFFFGILILFLITGIFYAIFKFLSLRKNTFKAEEPEFLCLLMLVSGWPGVIVLLPLGFALAIIYSVGSIVFFKEEQTSPLPAFLFATFIALVGGKVILSLLHLYPLLKL